MSWEQADDGRLFAPATLRNRGALLDLMQAHLPAHGTVVEIASGSGEHVVHFARAFPNLTFLPSDPDADARRSIDAWVAHEAVSNIEAARAIDVTADTLPHANGVLCINMIHIAPWAATVGLVERAAAALPADGVLILYGPFKRSGAQISESNAAFDASLRARDSRWGVRDLEAVSDVAQGAGFGAPDVIEMPANNLGVVWRRS